MSTQLKLTQWVQAIFYLVIWGSCTYVPDEEIFNDIPGPVVNNISLTNQTDTVYLFEKSSLSLPLHAPGKEVYKYKVMVGEEYVSSYYNSGKLTFELDPAEFPDGIYPLTVEVILSTGTGSLADKLKKETVVFSKQYYVNIDLSPPARVSAPAVTVEDGRLIIRWDRAEKENFREYKLLKLYQDRDKRTKTDTLYTGDFNTGYFHDSLYTGGKVEYRIDIKGYNFYVAGEGKSFELDPIKLKVSLVDEKTVKISWSEFALYNNKLAFRIAKTNYAAYYLSYSGTGYYYQARTISAEKEGEVLINFEERFGNPELYEFRIVPDHEDWYHLNNYSEHEEIGIGTRIHRFSEVAFSPSAEKMYLIHPLDREGQAVRLFSYDLNVMKPIDSLDLQLTAFHKLLVSENGMHIYVADKVGPDIRLLQVNPTDLSLRETTSISGMLGTSLDHYAVVTPPSNNNRIVVSANFQYNTVIDMNQKAISWQSEAGMTVDNEVCISPNGEYVFHTQKDSGGWYAYILQWQNNSWNKLGRMYFRENERVLGFKTGTATGFITEHDHREESGFYPIINGAMGAKEIYPRTDYRIGISGYNSTRDELNGYYSNYSDSYIFRYNYQTNLQLARLFIESDIYYSFYGNMYFANSGYVYVVQE